MNPISRNVKLLKWFNFFTDFLFYAPIMIIYFGQVAGSYTLGMTVYSVVMLAQFTLEVPTGILSDRLGRRPTVILSAAARVLSVVAYAAADGFSVLVIGAIFEGLARSFASGNNDALLYETLVEMDKSDQFQDELGKTNASYQFALAIAALLGGVIAVASYRLTVILTIIPLLLAFIVSIGFVEPRTHTRAHLNPYEHLGEAVRYMLRNRSLRLVTAAGALSFAFGETSFQIRSVFIQSLWPVWAMGIARMLANAFAAVSFYFAGPLIRRFGELRLLIGGKTLSEAINFVCVIFPTPLSPVWMAANSIFFGVNMVAAGSLLQREFTDEQRATMGSLSSFVGSILLAIVSPILGAMADHLGIHFTLAFASVFTILPLYFYWLGLRPAQPIQENTPQPIG